MTHIDRVKSIIRHIKKQYPDYSLSECIFHKNKPCLTLLNNFDKERFHCLFANHAVIWKSYSITKSCDLPDHIYDMILLNRLLGDEYVLPFASSFRESSGYTVAMFRQNLHLYTPIIIDRGTFKRMTFAMIVIYVAVCYRMGGVTPDIKLFSLVYTKDHPVLCDMGALNAEKKELIDGKERFDRKKWITFLSKKRMVNIIRFLKGYFPKYFQKKKPGKRCILYDGEHGIPFDDETHALICQNKYLIDVLQKFKHLIPNLIIRDIKIKKWIKLAKIIVNSKRN